MKRVSSVLKRQFVVPAILLFGASLFLLSWTVLAPSAEGPVEAATTDVEVAGVPALLASHTVERVEISEGVERRLVRDLDDGQGAVPTNLMRAWLDSKPGSALGQALVQQIADSAHTTVMLEDRFPSANACQSCHPDQYREWSVSSHSYSQLSPIFNAMHGTIVKLTNGSNGDFCIRCHTQVGMNLEEEVFMSNMDRNPTSREGITCIVCHRVENAYSKVSGRFAIVEGDLFDPVFGPDGEEILDEVIEDPDFNVNTQRGASGRA